ncbi:MAG: hypothetical protein Q7J38_12860 [Gallionella sp.]|nr:hypothetical protein [Gallionella sp.]
MASTHSQNNSFLDNLPLLNQVVETDTPDDLPTLTEVVADAANDLPETTNDSVDTKDTQPAAAPRVLGEDELQQILHYLKAHIETILPAPPALPPRVLDEDELQQALHYLETHIETILPEAVPPPPRALGEEELQQILHHLEAHVETMLASKLSLHFEKLRDALNAHLDSKIQ